MYTKEFLFLNKDLINYEWIGGWEDWDEDGLIHLWRRNKNGERVIVSVKNVPRYMCIPKNTKNKTDLWPLWKKNKFYINGVSGKHYDYVYLNGLKRDNLNGWFTILDDLGITPLEADVTRLARLMIDLNLRVASPSSDYPPRVCFYDIETNDLAKKIEIGKESILSAAVKDGKTGEEFFFYKDNDEADFLIKFLNKLYEYDVIVGYNNYQFDDPYILGRCEELSIPTSRFKRLCKLDMYNLFERQHTFKTYGVENKKLDSIARCILGRGKIEHKEKIYDLWESNRELLKEYNLEDVRLIFELEKKLQSVNLVLEVMSLSGTLFSFGFSTYRCIDNLLLRKAHENRIKGIVDYRYPTAFFRPEHQLNNISNKNSLAADRRKSRATILKEQFDIDYQVVKGALVLDVEPGIYDNVHIADFNSLYPNTMRTFNIGMDTYIEGNTDLPHNECPSGAKFRLDIKSNLAEVVGYLLDSRAEVKKKMKELPDGNEKSALNIRQNALKELANSCYGVLALWGSRYYSPALAESVTSGGRYFLTYAVDFFQQRGYRIVAGDTDSIFLQLPENENPQKQIDDYLLSLRENLIERFNCKNPEYLKLSLEKTAKRLFIIAKKLYVMKLSMKDGKPSDETIYKGLKVVKSNISRWSSNGLKKLLEDILVGKSYDYFEDFLKKEKEKLISGEWDWKDFIITQRLGKPVEKYVSELPHVRVAKRLVEKGNFITEYSNINYIVVGRDGSKIDAVDESEVEIGKTKLDVTYYWNNEFMEGVLDYLPLVFPNVEWEIFKFPNSIKRKPFECKVIICQK